MSSHSAPTKARVLFGLSTVALLTATHWPGLSIHGPFSRTDLIIHATVFTAWTVLLGRSVLVRPSILLVIGVAFAVFDETTQPLMRRVFDWWDLVADVAGVGVGVLISRIPSTLPEQNDG